ncbi:MAG: hypothetical protein NC311_08105 [Muribaculaceae bacterium]|nr:hypothetical protein [Muribaculaceae bacterium]MCM1439338.1 hypothetical protein [Roseburia sp.]
MSKETKQPKGEPATTAEQPKAEKPHTFPKPCVYCGPSVRGVARQYTVYSGSIPEPLRAFIEEHPAARGLMVSVQSFAKTRSNLGKRGTAEAVLYEKIKSEL